MTDSDRAHSELDGPPRDLSREVEALVLQWSGTIVRAARQYGLDTAEQDEVTQDMRVRFWHLLRRTPEGAPAVNATYATRAAMSAAVDLVRRDRQRRDARHEALTDEAPDRGSGDHELSMRLTEALDAIMPSRRVAVQLHLDGRSLADIARVMRWTEAQARNQVYRGLADLKAHLSGSSDP